ncbi:hypothetical protein PIB30_103279 [Stylosanthes scabra]|uniref:Uncharacterized protein n=1 Tax=Stylosanthes scabra TaxID=79078 RepID=A0ABU6YWV8_9FABA|nr:hypothetical protein [Stylosanthes scabra]
MLEPEFLQPRPIISTVHPFFYLIADLHNYRMTRIGKTSTKGSASAAAGSTAGNLSQLLPRSCFRRVSKNNSS